MCTAWEPLFAQKEHRRAILQAMDRDRFAELLDASLQDFRQQLLDALPDIIDAGLLLRNLN